MLNGTKEGDVYSIGMIMYEMFEKKVPFEGLDI
jgi:serine/threonine protein kinase